MVLDIFKSMISVFWQLLRLPLFCILFVVGVLLILIFCWFIYWVFIEKVDRPVGTGKAETKRKPSFFEKIFIQLPKQVAYDTAMADPDKFGYQGMIIFTGRQGGGKTVSMTQYIMEMHEEYPKSKIITNYGYVEQDEELTHWRKLIGFNNDKYGVIAAIDELQNWFSSNQSKDFPPEMLGVITQNRKNKRVILGTAQSFHLLSKAIRSQTIEVRECWTFLKCFTVVHKREPVLDADGNVHKYENRGWYFFVHDQHLREMYDTYKVIENLSKSGFKEKSGIEISVSTKS